MARRIPLNENGRRINEGHHNVRHSDEVVEMCRCLREEGKMIKEIAEQMGLPFETARAYCRYHRRAQVPRAWKKVEDE